MIKFHCNKCGWVSEEKSCPTHLEMSPISKHFSELGKKSWEARKAKLLKRKVEKNK